CSRNVRWVGVNSDSEASSSTALTWSSNSTGSTMTLRGAALSRPDSICTVPGGTSSMRISCACAAHWPTRPSPTRSERAAGELAQAAAVLTPGAFARVALDHVHQALLRIHQRCELAQQHASQGQEVALALHHVGELGQVGLQPVLLAVGLGGGTQGADHRVHV